MSQATATPDFVLQQLQWRYAVKQFDSTKVISDDLWQTLEQTLLLAPSSFGLQPWKFIVVRDPDVRQQLVEASWGQTQVVEASHLVVLAIPTEVDSTDVDRFVQRMADVRQTPAEKLQGYGNMVKGFLQNPPFPVTMKEWATRQVYIALGQLMTSAAMLGIDTCPMEGFIPAKYDEILGLTERGLTAVVVCPAGYRADGDKYATMAKVRYPHEDVFHYVG
ncbi:MAG: NAD(P)H-dependent oxidoreductase [Cyanobacteria bacterium P01_D01_bin.123]